MSAGALEEEGEFLDLGVAVVERAGGGAVIR